jgi:ribosomal protein S8
MRSIYCALGAINNALRKKQKYIYISYTKNNYLLCKLFFNEGYLYLYTIHNNYILIEFNSYEDRNILNGLRIFKNRSRRNCFNNNNLYIESIKKKKKYLLLTTLGLCFSSYALKNQLGGIALAELY